MMNAIRNLSSIVFFEHLSIWQMSEKLQYSESTIKTVIARNACLLFADMLAMVTNIDLRKGKP